MASPSRYSFGTSRGPCSIDTDAREVRLGGQTQRTAPRVFDLLAYLVEHRNRVVSQDELLDRVWKGAFLSGSAIASAVMKARQAVGDDAGAPRIIRTVHRVGYRFIGPVTTPGAVARAPSTDAPLPAREALRLAVLPVDNRTGERRLSWVGLGLLSLVNEALQADARLHVASVASVLTALEIDPAAGGSGPAAPDAALALLARRTGARWVCRIGIDGDASAGFALRYQLDSVDGERHRGSVTGPDPATLCGPLARAIQAALFGASADAGGASAGAGLPAYDSARLGEIAARAREALEAGRPAEARGQIDAALAAAPDDARLQRERLRILAALADPEALSLGAASLERAEAAGDSRQAAELHLLLYQVRSAGDGPQARADHHLAEALRLTDPARTDDGALVLRNVAALRAIERAEHEEARALLDEVATASEAVGNRLQQLHAISNQAMLDAAQGNLRSARGLWLRALRGYEALGHRRRGLVQHGNLFEACAHLGLLDEGLAHGDAAAALIVHAAADRDIAAACASLLCTEFALARRPERVAGVLDQLARLQPFEGVARAHAWAAEAQGLAGADGEAAAARLLTDAIALAARLQRAQDARQWAPLLLHRAMRTGHHAEAAALAATLRAQPALRDAPDLAGMALHAEALACHRHGQRALARARLHEALATMSPSRWSVLVRLDAAWLDIERGDLAAAHRVLVGSYSWLAAHPLGRLVQARLAWARGRGAEAADLLGASRPFFAPDDPDLARLAGAGFGCADGTAGAPLPALQRLPSIL